MLSVYKSNRFLLPFIVCTALLTGCAGPKVATDLLQQIPPAAAPKVENGVVVNTTIDGTIRNYEGLDVTLRESLITALQQANLFSPGNTLPPYTIQAHIDIASQAAFSFGNFEGTLQVTYKVMNEKNEPILEKTIHTIAGSDSFSFSGAKRHRRARAVNMAKNVTEFTEYLKGNLVAATQ